MGTPQILYSNVHDTTILFDIFWAYIYIYTSESDVHKVISVKIKAGRLLIRIIFKFNKQTVWKPSKKKSHFILIHHHSAE